MDVRVITLRYQEGVQGFPEEALRKAISGREDASGYGAMSTSFFALRQAQGRRDTG